MQRDGGRTSRRRLLGAAAAVAPMLALVESPVRAAPSVRGTPESESSHVIAAPDWTFSLFELQDPYPGMIQVPQSPPPGTRYVGAEVEVDNSSDQPLAFTPAEIRLRDITGVEYRGGSAIGTEPSINPRNLNAGERSRGWVWFTVGTETDLVTLVYVGPQPQFKIDITG